MSSFTAIVIFLSGLFLGGFAAWFLLRYRISGAIKNANAELELQIATLNERLAGRDRQIAGLDAQSIEKDREVNSLKDEITGLKTEQSKLQTVMAKERQAVDEKLALLEQAKTQLADAFKALSSDALKSNNRSFLDLAQQTFSKYQEVAKGELDQRKSAIDELVKPIQQSLKDFDDKVQKIEKDRAGAYGELSQQVKSLLDTEGQLRLETGKLVRALSAPRTRGRWGELQLKRVVELAGMMNHCDFVEQQTASTEEGRLRPDMIVRLPSGKSIVVDAKAPLDAYLEAIATTDDGVRKAKLVDHARQVRDRITELSKKSYWAQFQPTPEIVVLFIPGEAFFSAALEQDPSLIEQGANGVILATPTTLIALLKAVYYGWNQENLTANAQKISALGRDLYKRVSSLAGHFESLGNKLKGAVESYNNAIGSLENRVLTSARQFQNLDVATHEPEIATLPSVELTPRQMQVPEAPMLDRNSDKES
jgi:DNA recombination protein RmuC